MNNETLLYRQIHPEFICKDKKDKKDRVTSQAFMPSKEDNGLSVYDGDQITAEKAWKHYVYSLKYCSIGVQAVRVSECRCRGLPVKSDSKPNFPHHALIDFSQCKEKKDVRHKAKELRRAAQSHGWQYEAHPCARG